MNKKLKFTIIGFILIITNLNISAKQVDISTAKVVAKNCYYENVNNMKKMGYDDISVSQSFTVTDGINPVYYVFNFLNHGFVIVSADDIVYPIIGYSLNNDYINENQPDNFKFWMNQYKDEIVYSRNIKLLSNDDIEAKWQHFLSKPGLSPSITKSIVISPLLTCSWDQGTFYNTLCPADASGPGGHAVTGCVATAMAQVMYYYRYPTTGQGSHSYNSQLYGNLSVNCGATTYNWNAMQDNLSAYNLAVETIIYQAGVTVDMDYSPTGSSASVQSAANAFSSHFRYGTVTDNDRSNFNATSWMNLIKTELNANRPVLYAGNDTASGEGHAFVCDGYDSNNNFHFNWGWSGYYDGYFTLSNLNPGNMYHFNNYQEALTNIYPATNYPPYCTGTTTLTSQTGTFEDGSGPNDYQNNINCMWLISPSNATSINLSFSTFSTASSNDEVIIYDGATTSDSVLGTFYGSSLPLPLTSTGGQMLVRFITDQSIVAAGWHASYYANIPPLCPSLTTLTTPSGQFTDGSGSNPYAYNTSCDWEIAPPGATSITLGFTSFNLAAGDKVRMYDLSQSPALLLATFTGTSIPPTATYTTGQLVLNFTSTPTGSAQGWSAFYSSVISGIENNGIDNSLDIYPNPADKLLNVSFNSPGSKTAGLEIFSVIGQIVQSDVINNSSGKFSGIIDVSDFHKGIYFLKIITEKVTVTRKIIVQ